MLKDHSETKTESTIFADLEGLKPISQILKNHHTYYIQCPSKGLLINADSIEKICKMVSMYPEETIVFTYRTRITAPNYEDEDSFIFSYRNRQQTNKIIDNNDDILYTKSNNDDNDELNNNMQTLANSGDLEQGIIESMTHKTFFERNINVFVFLWEVSYLSLLLSGVVVFCHLNFFSFSVNSFFSPYMISGMVVNCLLFYTGFLGLYYIKIEKVQKINETWENAFLILLIVLTSLTFALGEYAISQPMKDYLIQNSFFHYLFYWLIFNESSCLLLNFKMNQFYVEYNFLLPLKCPLLPSTARPVDTDEF